MNVVLYLRYSSDKQNEQSIEGQRRICEAYCKQQKLNIVDEYIDRALSAVKNIDKREGFQQMIKDSKKRNFQAIIVYKLDRFARNRYDSATYKAKLKENGVKVISATEPISDSPEGVLLESVLEGMAEFYSKELAQKVTRGMRETAMKGNSCGGTLPLGYKIVDKKYTIDPTTAPIVKEIFKRYAEGEKQSDIAKDLNARGIKTVRGNSFNKNSFHTMFTNRKYIGVLTYNDIEIENAIPAIIDKNTFETVQAMMNTRKQKPALNKGKTKYLLSGVLYCGHCSSPMTGEHGTGENGQKYYYYACSGKRRYKNCDKKNVAKDIIEKAVLEDIFDFLTPENIEKVADIAIKQAEKENKGNTEIKRIKKEIKATEQKIHNILTLIENGNLSESLQKRLTELELRKEDLETELREEELNIVHLDKKIIVYWLTYCLENYCDNPDFHEKLINMLVNAIYVFDEPDGFRITIAFNLSKKETSRFILSDFKNDGSPKKPYPNGYGLFCVCPKEDRSKFVKILLRRSRNIYFIL